MDLNENQYRYLLTPSEVVNLGHFEEMWLEQTGLPAQECPDAFFNLKDNPHERAMWSLNGKLPAFRARGGRIWNPHRRRWLTSREMLACLGYPTMYSLAAAGRCPVFQADGPHASKMAGNAWHMHCAGVVLLVALSCVEVSPQWARAQGYGA